MASHFLDACNPGHALNNIILTLFIIINIVFLQRSPQDHPAEIQKRFCCLSTFSFVRMALGGWNIRT